MKESIHNLVQEQLWLNWLPGSHVTTLLTDDITSCADRSEVIITSGAAMLLRE